ncbi:hypothetical protein IWZ03DRAFT_1162 [Phyllosticta citriasiana]|uniref:Uncharacterized protein n=1 Tax=Phyllosticta citriasiana TaxID=595635 RepID=A0ABR1L106_9PEZI
MLLKQLTRPSRPCVHRLPSTCGLRFSRSSPATFSDNQQFPKEDRDHLKEKVRSGEQIEEEPDPKRREMRTPDSDSWPEGVTWKHLNRGRLPSDWRVQGLDSDELPTSQPQNNQPLLRHSRADQSMRSRQFFDNTRISPRLRPASTSENVTSPDSSQPPPSLRPFSATFGRESTDNESSRPAGIRIRQIFKHKGHDSESTIIERNRLSETLRKGTEEAIKAMDKLSVTSDNLRRHLQAFDGESGREEIERLHQEYRTDIKAARNARESLEKTLVEFKSTLPLHSASGLGQDEARREIFTLNETRMRQDERRLENMFGRTMRRDEELFEGPQKVQPMVFSKVKKAWVKSAETTLTKTRRPNLRRNLDFEAPLRVVQWNLRMFGPSGFIPTRSTHAITLLSYIFGSTTEGLHMAIVLHEVGPQTMKSILGNDWVRKNFRVGYDVESEVFNDAQDMEELRDSEDLPSVILVSLNLCTDNWMSRRIGGKHRALSVDLPLAGGRGQRDGRDLLRLCAARLERGVLGASWTDQRQRREDELKTRMENDINEFMTTGYKPEDNVAGTVMARDLTFRQLTDFRWNQYRLKYNWQNNELGRARSGRLVNFWNVPSPTAVVNSLRIQKLAMDKDLRHGINFKLNLGHVKRAGPTMDTLPSKLHSEYGLTFNDRTWREVVDINMLGWPRNWARVVGSKYWPCGPTANYSKDPRPHSAERYRCFIVNPIDLEPQDWSAPPMSYQDATQTAVGKDLHAHWRGDASAFNPPEFNMKNDNPGYNYELNEHDEVHMWVADDYGIAKIFKVVERDPSHVERKKPGPLKAWDEWANVVEDATEAGPPAGDHERDSVVEHATEAGPPAGDEQDSIFEDATDAGPPDVDPKGDSIVEDVTEAGPPAGDYERDSVVKYATEAGPPAGDEQDSVFEDATEAGPPAVDPKGHSVVEDATQARPAAGDPERDSSVSEDATEAGSTAEDTERDWN